jgi:hypothetical protein
VRRGPAADSEASEPDFAVTAGYPHLRSVLDGKYANYKLALILYASKVLSLTISNYTKIEDKLWSMQQSNGGITSLSDLNGNPIGSANTETTAMALLPYG